MTQECIINFGEKWRASTEGEDLHIQMKEPEGWRTLHTFERYQNSESIVRSIMKGHHDEGKYYFIAPGPICGMVEAKDDQLLFSFIGSNGEYRPQFKIAPDNIK
tara:strand:+ start:723 stop:1034 length:312 start_codon:yes stop_codon:yes gene_type:complete